MCYYYSKIIYKYLCLFFILFFIVLINDFIIVVILKNKIRSFKFENKNISSNSNINYNDEFFEIKEVIHQIKAKNLNNIETISCGGIYNIGNALVILNNLINICEKIHCKNIISPRGLQRIIKKPIEYKEYNIKIFPGIYDDIMNIDIKLGFGNSFFFQYKKKFHEMRLNIIKEEVFQNIPKYEANKSDMYLNIRSGDIFLNAINPRYGQPPLCFYKKIIDNNNYTYYYILSNGHENPVVDKLLEIYPKIRYIHGSIEYDIAVLVNVFNLALPVSTFPLALIRLNTNLKNLYIYEMVDYNLIDANYTIFKMKPSNNYIQNIKTKWKNTKIQLDLMITENCSNYEFFPYIFEKKNKKYFDFS